MKIQSVTCSLAVVFLMAAVDGHQAQTAADQPQSAPQSQTTADAEAKDSAGGESKTIHQRYLQKQHELAEHQYNAARQTNRDVGLVYSKQTLLKLRQQMEYTGWLLELHQQRDQPQRGKGRGTDAPPASDRAAIVAPAVKLVQQDLELATQRLQWAREANAAVVGSIPADDMRTYELRVELAELALQRVKQDDFGDDPMQHLQWQLNRLRSDLRQLQIEFEKTEPGS